MFKAGNRESDLGNEGKDRKQRNFFTSNNKQYTVMPGQLRIQGNNAIVGFADCTIRGCCHKSYV